MPCLLAFFYVGTAPPFKVKLALCAIPNKPNEAQMKIKPHALVFIQKLSSLIVCRGLTNKNYFIFQIKKMLNEQHL